MTPAAPLRRERGAARTGDERAESRSRVRPEFGPTLPVLLRRRRLPGPRAAVVALAATALALAALSRAGGADAADTTLRHREPDFTLLFAAGALRRVAPEADEHARLEGRGEHVRLTVTVKPLPRADGAEPGLSDLPILADPMIEDQQRRDESYRLFEEGRARVNDARGYQARWRSGGEDAPRFGHDVMLVPEPPLSGPGLLVSLRQDNDRAQLGPADRRLAYLAKRAFRSLRFGTERP